jgi:hypothetical protein
MTSSFEGAIVRKLLRVKKNLFEIDAWETYAAV